jgi:SAM-dependent methyltransferase
VLSPFSANYAREVSGGDPGFTAEIDPGDEMYGYGLRSLRGSVDAAAILYFSVGRTIADSVADAIAWRFRSPGPARVLDFAAGYGRATRFLVRRFAPGTLTAAEIDPAALAFQRRTLGVETLLAPGEAGDFRPAAAWDAVVASSFFSHLSEPRFRGWLGALWSVVAPGGLLLFSTHGPHLVGEGGDLSRGIVFRPESETDRLDAEAYGSSWVTEEFVRDAVRHSCTGGAVHAIPFGLDGRQDLYAVVRPPSVPAEPPRLRPVPRGELDRLDLTVPGKLACEGTLESEEEADVVFLAAESECGRRRIPSGAFVRRWRFEVAREGVSPDDVLRVEAHRAGRTRILAMGTLARL